MSIGAMFSDPKRRKVAIAVAAGLAVGVVVLLMRRGGASTSTSAQVVPTSPVPPTDPLAGSPVGSQDPLAGLTPAEPTVYVEPAAPLDLTPIADALTPLVDAVTNPAPAAGFATPAAPTSPQTSKAAGSVHPAQAIVWHGTVHPNIAAIQKANPGEHLVVKKRGGGQGYVVVSDTPNASAPVHPPAPAASPNPSAQPAAPAHPAGTPAGTILWSGKTQPNLGTIQAAHPGVRLEIKKRGGNLGYVVVAG